MLDAQGYLAYNIKIVLKLLPCGGIINGSVSYTHLWQKINYRGETAYISSDYLYMQEWESGTKLDIGTIIGDSGIVNVRSTPSAEGQVVLVALKGAKFVVVTIDKDSGWYQVGFPDGVGYIEPQYLSVQSTTIEKAFFS